METRDRLAGFAKLRLQWRFGVFPEREKPFIGGYCALPFTKLLEKVAAREVAAQVHRPTGLRNSSLAQSSSPENGSTIARGPILRRIMVTPWRTAVGESKRMLHSVTMPLPPTPLTPRIVALLVVFMTTACARSTSRTSGDAPVSGEPSPLVIAHRGASGHRPEHTLAGYALAIAMGADFIEPDLVSTKDGVLIARHENEIGGTTDVVTKFPDRKTVKVVDGDTVRGWFTEDFTLAEIRTLRAKERLPFRSHQYDGQFTVPTFDEVLALADSAGRRRTRAVGVYPETKHPTYFRNIGLPIEPKLLASLRANGLDRRDAPVFIQSFESGNLRELARETRVRLIYLISDPAQVTPAALRDIATYAFGIGANTRLVVGGDSAAVPTQLLNNAHAAGLKVHVWTLRSESVFLPKRYGGDPLAEVREMQRLGADGIFGDFPDVVVKGLRQ